MPNYKGVEVPHILLTDEDVAVHASIQDPATAVVYADASVEVPPTPADEPVVESHTEESSSEPEADTNTDPETDSDGDSVEGDSDGVDGADGEATESTEASESGDAPKAPKAPRNRGRRRHS